MIIRNRHRLSIKDSFHVRAQRSATGLTILNIPRITSAPATIVSVFQPHPPASQLELLVRPFRVGSLSMQLLAHSSGPRVSDGNGEQREC